MKRHILTRRKYCAQGYSSERNECATISEDTEEIRRLMYKKKRRLALSVITKKIASLCVCDSRFSGYAEDSYTYNVERGKPTILFLFYSNK